MWEKVAIVREEKALNEENVLKYTEGMEIVNTVATTKTNRQDRPVVDQIMVKVTVDTFGVEYDEPEKC